MAGIEGMVVSAVVKQAIRGLAAAVGSPMANLWGSCKKDLEEMRGILTLFEAALRDAERRSEGEEAVRVWLRQLKTVAHEISSVLDKAPPSPWKVFAKLSLVNKIDELKKKLKSLKENRRMFGFSLQNSSSNENVIAKRETVACMDDEFTVIGRSGENDEIIRLLLGSEENLAIISIVGLGGIGKTTLAKLVFNDSRMQDFDKKAWIYVSQRFDLGRIGKAVISQFEGPAATFDDLQFLYNQIENLCSGKRCLIVLDDLWESNIEMLRKLKLLLRCRKNGTLVKVIVTTRNEEIAQEMSTFGPYKLGPLSDDSCWTVFRQVAFQWTEEEILHVLEAVGRDIAKKCKGLPLAAHAVGSMLRNRTVDFWKATRDNNVWDQYSSHEDVLPSLRLSYDHMPSYLKPCFAYCAIFQKGSAIDKDKLIQQWIALGFIKPSLPDLSYRVQAEEYLREILATSLLQNLASSLVTHLYAKTSQHLIMHDLVHDLARSVAGDETLFLDCTKPNNLLTDSFHHVVVVRYDKRLSKSLPVQVRSLHFRDSGGMWNKTPGLPVPGDAFSSTKNLHVLDITGCALRKLSGPIHHLAHLRYLDASLLPDKDLPTWITGLLKLHYLSILGLLTFRSCLSQSASSKN